MHVAAHYRERAQHRREVLTSEGFVDIAADAPRPDDLIMSEQLRVTVLELLQTLDDDVRALLIAKDIDGVSMAVIAEEIGIPISTAYKWRARALAALRDAAERGQYEES